jgi:hypothetical protein
MKSGQWRSFSAEMKSTNRAGGDQGTEDKSGKVILFLQSRTSASSLGLSDTGGNLLWKSENAHEQDQNGGCCGSTELAIVVPRRSWRGIFLCKTGDRHKERKKEQKGKKQRPCGN